MSQLLADLLASSPAEILAVVLAIAYLVLAIRQSIWCWAAAIVSTSLYVVLMYDARLYMESALQLFYIAIALYGWWHWTHPTPVAAASAVGTAAAVGAASAANKPPHPVGAASAANLAHLEETAAGFFAAEAAPTASSSPTASAPLTTSATPTGATLPVTTWPLRHHALAITAVLLLSGISGWLLARHTDAALPYLDSFTTWGAMLATWMVARKLLENWYYWFVIDSAAIWLYLHRGLHLTALLFAVYLVLIVIGYLAWRRSMRRDAMATSVAASP